MLRPGRQKELQAVLVFNEKGKCFHAHMCSMVHPHIGAPLIWYVSRVCSHVFVPVLIRVCACAPWRTVCSYYRDPHWNLPWSRLRVINVSWRLFFGHLLLLVCILISIGAHSVTVAKECREGERKQALLQQPLGLVISRQASGFPCIFCSDPENLHWQEYTDFIWLPMRFSTVNLVLLQGVPTFWNQISLFSIKSLVKQTSFPT